MNGARTVTIQLPRMLAKITGGERRYRVGGTTLREALDDLIEQQPKLGYHLFDDAGRMRPNILCFCNEGHQRGRNGLEIPIQPGDTITILNSVSGG